MKRATHRLLSALLILCLISVPVFATQELIPVGEIIGLELNSGTLTVAAFDDAVTAARDAGIRIGDEIISIDSRAIQTAQDVRLALDRSDGTVELTVRRDDKERTFSLSPAVSADGPKMGIYLRQGIMGIGTVTFYDPDTGRFGTLGHSVNDGKGQILQMTGGNAYNARVIGIQKGKTGAPGQLKGAMEGSAPLGKLNTNTVSGVFGTAPDCWTGNAIPIAQPEEVETGRAVIRCTVNEEGPREYSVEIVKIYSKSKDDNRNMLIRVTDPHLIAATGGIVQGMSGSPIIQNGKLIGAVTHVLVNDPMRGYGIFIENMLDAVE